MLVLAGVRAAAAPLVAVVVSGVEEAVGPEDPDFPYRLDATKPFIVSAWGRKGSGKSHLNGLLYQSFPGDKLAIDVNGHAYVGPDAERITELPKRWPAGTPQLGERRRPRNLHYQANPAADTYRDDLDRAVAMALFPKDHPVLLWAGEVGELTPNSKARPHMRQLLMQNRHHRVAALFDGPRPMNVDVLVLAQSDLVAVFDLPNPADRKRIADSIGYPPKKFDEVCQETWARSDPSDPGSWHVLWDGRTRTLWQVPPLPQHADRAAA